MKKSGKPKAEVKARFKIVADSGKFAFTAGSTEILKALAHTTTALMSSAGSQIKGHVVHSTGNELWILGYSSDTFAACRIDKAECSTPGSFAFGQQTLSGLVKGRGDMSFAYSRGVVEFKSVKGTYTGSVPTQQLTDEVAQLLAATLSSEGSTSASLPRELISVLREGVACTAVSDVFDSQPLLSYITLNSGRIAVSSFDKHHFGMFEAKVADKELKFEVALPSRHFTIIDKIASEGGVSFSVRPDCLRVHSESFILVLPTCQTDAKNFTLMRDYIKELGDPTFRAELNLSDLSKVISNLIVLNVDNAKSIMEIRWAAGSKKLVAAFSTTNGSASDSVKIRVPDSSDAICVKLDPRILKDLISLSGTGEASFITVGNVMMLTVQTRSGKARLACALSS